MDLALGGDSAEHGPQVGRDYLSLEFEEPGALTEPVARTQRIRV